MHTQYFKGKEIKVSSRKPQSLFSKKWWLALPQLAMFQELKALLTNLKHRQNCGFKKMWMQIVFKAGTALNCKVQMGAGFKENWLEILSFLRSTFSTPAREHKVLHITGKKVCCWVHSKSKSKAPVLYSSGLQPWASRCSWTSTPRNPGQQRWWWRFLGVVVQEHLEAQGWGPLA